MKKATPKTSSLSKFPFIKPPLKENLDTAKNFVQDAIGDKVQDLLVPVVIRETIPEIALDDLDAVYFDPETQKLAAAKNALVADPIDQEAWTAKELGVLNAILQNPDSKKGLITYLQLNLIADFVDSYALYRLTPPVDGHTQASELAQDVKESIGELEKSFGTKHGLALARIFAGCTDKTIHVAQGPGGLESLEYERQ